MRNLAALALATTLLAGPVFAHPSAMAPGQMAKGDMAMRGGPAGAEYMQAMTRMQKGMMAAHDPDPGRMWAMMMIPHHQGAVDTARITLKYAKDPEIRRINQNVIDGQSKDIAELEAWLDHHGGRPSPH